MKSATQLIIEAQQEVARGMGHQLVPALVGHLLQADTPREVWAAYLKERPLVDRYTLARPDTPDPQDLRQEARAAGQLDVSEQALAFRRLFPSQDVGLRLCSHLTGVPSLAGTLAAHEFTARRHVLGPRGWSDGLWVEVCSAFQEQVARLIGDDLSLGDVSWFSSTSDALQAVIGGQRGRLVFTSGHFSSAHYIHHHWARSGHGTLVEVPVDKRGRVATLRLLQALSPDTRVVSLAHVLPRSGWVQDLVGVTNVIADRCPDALLVLDVATSAGVMPVDVRQLPPRTAIVGTGRTYLRAGPGVAFAWVSKEALGELQADRTGWWAHAEPADRVSGPLVAGQGASVLRTGTPPVRDLYALVSELGVLASRCGGDLRGAIQDVHTDVTTQIVLAAERALELGLDVLGHPLGPATGPVLCLHHERAVELGERLAEEHIEVSAWADVAGGNSGVLRLSGNSTSFAYELLHAVERIAAL